MAEKAGVDELDVALLQALTDHPRAGALELARITGVARATVTARIETLERSGVVTGYGPDIDLVAAGLGVQAFVTLEIAQGAIEDVEHDLREIPGRSRGLRDDRRRRRSCAESRPVRTKHCNGFSSR